MNCPKCDKSMSGGGYGGHPDYKYYWCSECQEQFEYNGDGRFTDSEWELVED